MASTIASILGGNVLDGISKVIDSIRGKSPQDALALEELKNKYQEDFLNSALQQRAQDLAAMQAQTGVNQVEAASDKTFVAGWRPFIGWICGTIFLCNFVVGPIVNWICIIRGMSITFPKMDLSEMMPVLIGMLGLGGFRTYEKTKGVATTSVGH